MGASYLLSSSLVPVLRIGCSDQTGPRRNSTQTALDRFRHRFLGVFERGRCAPVCCWAAYAIVAALVLLLVTPRLAREIFPSAASTQFRLRFDAPDGTRVPVTEEMMRRVLDIIP